MVVTNYRYKGMTLPKSIENKILDFVESGTNTSTFLNACLANDLTAAYINANDWECELIPVITMYLYHKVSPTICLGSWGAIKRWHGMEAYENWKGKSVAFITQEKRDGIRSKLVDR